MINNTRDLEVSISNYTPADLEQDGFLGQALPSWAHRASLTLYLLRGTLEKMSFLCCRYVPVSPSLA